MVVKILITQIYFFSVNVTDINANFVSCNGDNANDDAIGSIGKIAMEERCDRFIDFFIRRRQSYIKRVAQNSF